MKLFFAEIKEPIKTTMIGNYAVAGAVTQTDPDVVCAFPITPQTQSVEGLSDVVHQGRLKAAFINVESELAAMSYSTAACATGARTFTATASQGYLLMTEALPMAVGWRVPLTMMISARAFNSPNLSIWNTWEFTETNSEIGWNCIVSENVQETYDAAILSVMISEDSLFPTMFVHDGFIISHSVQNVTLIPDETVRKLTPKKPRHRITPKKPGTWGGIVTPSYFMEFRKSLDVDKEPVLDIMENAFNKFEKATGREYNLIETYNLDNSSKTAFVSMGSMCGNIISWMIKNPEVGLIKIRAFRPFPYEELRKIVEDHGLEKLIILEKSDSLNGMLPPFSMSVASALYPLGTIFRSFIVGLGGRDVTRDELDVAKQKMEKVDDMSGKLYMYLGVRETKNKIYGVNI
ncbi:MAG: pyruvate ferredoxin oxidoreductase [Candidatus Lokiarchaeota archaeon]|nr:pyruvate ferredoxin oxidoreductase [Candidatus Lokiarchaeota archaeon]MBD3200310.1 pyruvate ferredoxin oxidoreductase [Candidatus Lokiarchaeota archaeon]